MVLLGIVYNVIHEAISLIIVTMINNNLIKDYYENRFHSGDFFPPSHFFSNIAMNTLLFNFELAPVEYEPLLLVHKIPNLSTAIEKYLNVCRNFVFYIIVSLDCF